ncbi:MAG: phosphatase PAP2 family protein [bacterium]|nr:phosphatase PAP2 family protein [bacterium]
MPNFFGSAQNAKRLNQSLFFLLIASSFFGLNLKAQHAEIELLRTINMGRNKAIDPVWEALSYSVTPLAISVSGGMIIAQLYTKDSAQRYKTLFICGTVLTAATLTTSLKYAVGRERPYITYPELDENTQSTSPSFPSGHTSSAFALSTSLSVMYPKWYVVAPAYLWAGSVAYSRLALGAHYPSDVFTGAIIGSGSAWLSYKLNNWLNKKAKKPQ